MIPRTLAPVTRRERLTKATLLCITLALSGAAGCSHGSDSTTAPRTDSIGVYTLQSIAATAVPVKVFDGSAEDATTGNWYEQFIVTIKNGTFELDAQGKYHSSFAYTLVHDGVSEDRTLVADGAYSITGSDLTLRRSDGQDVSYGSVKDGRLAIEMTVMRNTPTKAYVFTK